MDFTELISVYSVFIFCLVGFSLSLPILKKYKTVNKRDLPKRRKLNEFYILRQNLLLNEPFSYGYTLAKDGRVVQVASEDELNYYIANNYKSIFYVKKNSNDDFVLFGSEGEDLKNIQQWKYDELSADIKGHRYGWISFSLPVLFLFAYEYFFLEGKPDVFAYLFFLFLFFILFWLIPYLVLVYIKLRIEKKIKS